MSEIVTQRRISSRAFTGQIILAAGAGLVLASILWFTGLGMFSVVGILLPLGVYGYSEVARRASSYQLYTDRLEIESGILSRKIENIELFRVRDVGLRQGFWGRIANFGDVYIHSTDSSTPDIHVRAIDGPKEFYQQVRDLVSQNRAHNRTMIVEESAAMPEA